MTNKEILIEIIKKAEKNGYTCPFYFINDGDIDLLDDLVLEIYDENFNAFERFHAYEIIYSHSFAKAFWGERRVTIANEPETTYGNVPRYKCQRWEYQLQRLVLEKEPLKYIQRFL